MTKEIFYQIQKQKELYLMIKLKVIELFQTILKFIIK